MRRKTCRTARGQFKSCGRGRRAGRAAAPRVRLLEGGYSRISQFRPGDQVRYGPGAPQRLRGKRGVVADAGRSASGPYLTVKWTDGSPSTTFFPGEPALERGLERVSGGRRAAAGVDVFTGRPLSTRAPKIPTVITHANMGPLLDAIRVHPYFQPGPQKVERPVWLNQTVVLELPTGELLRGGLTTMALLGGRPRPVPMDLTGREGFNAQGLEGKVQIRKDLFIALLNLRDILPKHRGRILTGKAAKATE